MLDDVIKSIVEDREHAVLVFQDWYEEHKHEYKLLTYPVGYAIRPNRTREGIRIFGVGFDRSYRVGDESNIAKYSNNSGGIIKAKITRFARAGLHLMHDNFEHNVSLEMFIRLNSNDDPLPHRCSTCSGPNVGSGWICFTNEHEGVYV